MSAPDQTILVVGGGIAGTGAALHIAAAGRRAVVIDEAPVIGGALLMLDKSFPTDSCGVCFMAPQPPALCPFFECEAHPDIELRPATTLTRLTGQAGHFQARLATAARPVDAARCTGCGLCVDVCPETVPAGQAGVRWPGETHKAIYRPAPQAVPPHFVIDAAACTNCGACVAACPHDAIDLRQAPSTTTVDVAAVILAPGFGPSAGQVRGAYGYGIYPDVITTPEFERMLSSSSLSQGRPVRPSDGRPARRIAIIHCAGSRDLSCGAPYCSAACCLIAAKQASLALRQAPGTDVTLFTMDTRAGGRGYERYLAALRRRPGVHYRRSLVADVKLDPAARQLRLASAAGGRARSDPFDLVVLAVGMVVPSAVALMVARAGVDVNAYGFAAPGPGPTATSRPGVFAAGAFREPKDIPDTVVEAIAAAAQALAFAGPAPVETADLASEAGPIRGFYDPPRIGVFIDGDDPELSDSLDLAGISAAALTWPDVVISGLDCSEGGLRSLIEHYGLTGLVVGRRATRPAGRERLVAGVPCTWVSLNALPPRLAGSTGALSEALARLRMAVAQARRARPRAAQFDRPVSRALVLGGGAAGMSAALTLSGQGVETHLVEREARLGGRPDEPAADLSQDGFGLVDAVNASGLITVHTGARLAAIDGRPGRRRARLDTANGPVDLSVGALVVATGAQPYEPAGFGLRLASHVVAQGELTAQIADWRRNESLPATVASVVMIQCAGARTAARPYCSRTCCVTALKNGIALKKIAPNIRVAIIYRDMVAPGFSELLYTEARRRGILFVRYEPAAPPHIRGHSVVVRDAVLDEDIRLPADVIVLSSGIAPDAEAPALARVLGLPLNEDGFFRPVNQKTGLLDLPYPGTYVAGLAGGPATAAAAIAQGMAAGLRAALFLRRARPAPATIATVNERLCSGCALCVAACPTGARAIDDETGLAAVDPWLCAGCGTCAAVCPNGASGQVTFEADGVLAAVAAALA